MIASGGFGDGRGLVAALALGAEDQHGHALPGDARGAVHDRVKQLLVASDERETRLIPRNFHNTARVGRSSVSDKVVEILSCPDAVFEDVAPYVKGALGRKVLEEGEIDAGLVWAGMVQGLIHDVPTVAELIGRIVGDARAIVAKRLAGMLT